MFVPREYQKLIIEHIVNNPRCSVFAGMGMGKTASTLFAIKKLKSMGVVKRVLVLAPLRVAKSTWPDEAIKWGDSLGLTIQSITGTPKERTQAIKSKADVYTMNYEGVQWLDQLAGGRYWGFDMIVADESTRLKSLRLRGGSKRARIILSQALKAKRFVNLTGTPAPNGLIDLWGQMYFIDKGERLERSFTAFTSKYFDQKQIGASRFAVKYVPCEFTADRIHEKLADLCISIQPDDYFNIEQPIILNVPVKLDDYAWSVYDALQDDMYTELKSGIEIDAVNAAVMTGKCLQVASGALYTDDNGNYEVIHDAKIDALKSVIEEASGTPVLVAYQYCSDKERILKAFPEAKELTADPKVLTAWNKGEIPILLAHPQSAGHGLNLQDGGNILVFFSHSWNLEHYMQIVERIGPTRQAQSGHPRPVFIYNIVAVNTLDEDVIARRESKKEVQEILLERLKMRDQCLCQK